MYHASFTDLAGLFTLRAKGCHDPCFACLLPHGCSCVCCQSYQRKNPCLAGRLVSTDHIHPQPVFMLALQAQSDRTAANPNAKPKLYSLPVVPSGHFPCQASFTLARRLAKANAHSQAEMLKALLPVYPNTHARGLPPLQPWIIFLNDKTQFRESFK